VEGGERSSRQIIKCATAALDTNTSDCGGRGGCLGFFVHLFSLALTLHPSPRSVLLLFHTTQGGEKSRKFLMGCGPKTGMVPIRVFRSMQRSGGGRFSVGSTLSLFLSELQRSGQIPETVTLYYTGRGTLINHCHRKVILCSIGQSSPQKSHLCFLAYRSLPQEDQ
jgi:hypothetical protein